MGGGRVTAVPGLKPEFVGPPADPYAMPVAPMGYWPGHEDDFPGPDSITSALLEAEDEE